MATKQKGKQPFTTDVSSKLGERRVQGCGDGVAVELRKCETIKEMVKFCKKRGCKDVDQYLTSGLHLGIVRMILGNKLRAVERRKSAKLNG